MSKEIIRTAATETRIAERPHKDVLFEIGNDLKVICELYGINQPRTEVLALIAQDIISEYPSLRRSEVVQAFKLAAKGRIKVSLDLYGKPLNLWLVHQILQVYYKERNKVLKEYNERKRREEWQNEPRQPMPEDLKLKMENLHKKINEQKETT